MYIFVAHSLRGKYYTPYFYYWSFNNIKQICRKMSQKVNTYKVHLRYSRFVDKLAKEGQYKPEVHNELAAECVCVYRGSCGGPDWPTSRISAAKPREREYSSRPDTALLFRWLIRSPTPASCAAWSSAAVSGGSDGHGGIAGGRSPSPIGQNACCGWQKQSWVRRSAGVNEYLSIHSTDKTSQVYHSICPCSLYSLILFVILLRPFLIHFFFYCFFSLNLNHQSLQKPSSHADFNLNC